MGRKRKPKHSVQDEYELERLRVQVKTQYGSELTNSEIRKMLADIEAVYFSNSITKK